MYYDIIESGKRIKEMRKKIGLTQAQISEKIGMSEDNYGRIERGINGASIDTFGVLSEILNCTAEYLQFGVRTMALSEQEIRVIMAMRGEI